MPTTRGRVSFNEDTWPLQGVGLALMRTHAHYKGRVSFNEDTWPLQGVGLALMRTHAHYKGRVSFELHNPLTPAKFGLTIYDVNEPDIICLE